MMPTTDERTAALLRIIREGNLEPDLTTQDVYVRYSYLFCEVCETQYREFLVRFEDHSVFTLCTGCVTDLKEVVELFGLCVAISAVGA